MISVRTLVELTRLVRKQASTELSVELNTRADALAVYGRCVLTDMSGNGSVLDVEHALQHIVTALHGNLRQDAELAALDRLMLLVDEYERCYSLRLRAQDARAHNPQPAEEPHGH